jgi:hypothetical protein
MKDHEPGRWVARAVVPVLLLCLLGFGGTGAEEDSPLEASGVPDINFSTLVWDGGEVFQGDVVAHVFTIYNHGSATLEILDVKRDCGCTATLTSQRRIPPHGQGTIEVNVNTKGIRGRTVKNVIISSNDPYKEQVTLRIEALVKVEVMVLPSRLYLGTIYRDLRPPGEIRLKYQGTGDFAVTKIECNSPDVGYELQDGANSNEALVKVWLKESAPLGHFTAALKMHTNSVKQSVIDVVVSALVFGDLELSPVRLFVTPQRVGEVHEGKVVLRDRSGRGDLQVKAVLDRDEYLELVTEVIRPGAEYNILWKTRKAPPRESPGPYEGVVLISTNRAGEERLELPYRGELLAPEGVGEKARGGR